MKIYDLYIEILIHFHPNLVLKLAKISPKMVVKNDVIFGKKTSPIISRHDLKPPSPPKPMTSFVNHPLVRSFRSDLIQSVKDSFCLHHGIYELKIIYTYLFSII